MNLISIDQAQILAFALVFLRCLGFLLSWPLFSGSTVPAPVKALTGLTLAMVCFTIVDPTTYPRVSSYQALLGLGVKELAFAFSLGFLCNLVFHAVSMAGELVSMAMGLSSAQIFNPTLNLQQSSVNQLYFFLTAFLFLMIQGHHHFITALATSFELVPLNMIFPNLKNFAELTLLGKEILTVAILLSAPVLVSIFLVNFCLGIIGRAVPQINVLITSLPVNALMGLAILGLSLPFFVDSIKVEITNFSELLFTYLKVF